MKPERRKVNTRESEDSTDASNSEPNTPKRRSNRNQKLQNQNESSIGNFFRVAAVGVALLSIIYFLSAEDTFRQRRFTVNDVPRTCYTAGQVALTFDQGPSPYTQAVLAAFRNNPNKRYATFHPVTTYINADVSVFTHINTAFNDGHVIGLALPISVNFNIMSDSDVLHTLQDHSSIIKSVIGVHPKFLRLTEEQLTDRVASLAHSMGFIITKYNIDSYDYLSSTQAWEIPQYLQTAMNQVYPSKAKYIMMLHDQYDVTANATEVLINTIDANGYTAVTLAECLQIASPYRTDAQNVVGSGANPGPQQQQQASGAEKVKRFFGF